jgi:hypothetical protein
MGPLRINTTVVRFSIPRRFLGVLQGTIGHQSSGSPRSKPNHYGFSASIEFTVIVAGPVGFEPTILGCLRPIPGSSEGPRLGPGSTTGPATIHHSQSLLLPCDVDY